MIFVMNSRVANIIKQLNAINAILQGPCSRDKGQIAIKQNIGLATPILFVAKSRHTKPKIMQPIASSQYLFLFMLSSPCVQNILIASCAISHFFFLCPGERVTVFFAGKRFDAFALALKFFRDLG